MRGKPKISQLGRGHGRKAGRVSLHYIPHRCGIKGILKAVQAVEFIGGKVPSSWWQQPGWPEKCEKDGPRSPVRLPVKHPKPEMAWGSLSKQLAKDRRRQSISKFKKEHNHGTKRYGNQKRMSVTFPHCSL